MSLENLDELDPNEIEVLGRDLRRELIAQGRCGNNRDDAAYELMVQRMLDRALDLFVKLPLSSRKIESAHSLFKFTECMEECATIRVDNVRARDVFAENFVSRFGVTQDLYRNLVVYGVSPKTQLMLFKGLVSIDANNSAMGENLLGLHDDICLEGFSFLFKKLSDGPVEKIAELSIILQRSVKVQERGRRWAEYFANNLDLLKPGYQKIMEARANIRDLDRESQNNVIQAFELTADFLSELHKKIPGDDLVTSMIMLAFDNPVGDRAYKTFENAGFIADPSWHLKRQEESMGDRLIQLHAYALVTDEIQFRPPEDWQLPTQWDINGYLKSLNGLVLESEESQKKMQTLVDHFLCKTEHKHYNIIERYFQSCDLDRKYFASHPNLLGRLFKDDLGL